MANSTVSYISDRTGRLETSAGPPHDGGMEARVARLESTSEHILRELVEMKADVRELRSDAKTDFRTLFGALIVVALGLSGLMAKGFGWL